MSNTLLFRIMHMLLLSLYLSSLYNNNGSLIALKTSLNKTKLNTRLTDLWFKLPFHVRNSTKHPVNYTANNSSENSLAVEDKLLQAGFGVSKPKPWRKDDPELIELNEKAEIVIDLDNPDEKPPAPEARQLSDYPQLAQINPKRCGVPEMSNERVVGGQDAKPGAYPWIAAILKNGDAWCGGTIINDRWIVTAAHCFMNDMNARYYAIRVGTIDRNTGTTYKVDKVIVHERFHLDNMFNSDVALMHVNRPIKMGKLVKPICLPVKAYEEPRSKSLLVVGWGKTKFENTELPTYLQEVVLNRVSLKNCAKKYQDKGNTIYFSQLCTWNKGQDACQGDSGGPAIEWRSQAAYLVGIVSYGSTCADEMPGVYTKVSFFIDWILKNIGGDENKVKNYGHSSDYDRNFK